MVLAPAQHRRTDEELRADFGRQRRNLIASSIALALYGASGISVTTISLLGNEFTVANPNVFPGLLAVAWLYFGARYHQYRMDLRDNGAMEAFRWRLDLAMKRQARIKLMEEYPDWRHPTDEELARSAAYTSITSYPTSDERWQVVFHAPFAPQPTNEQAAADIIPRASYEMNVSRSDRIRSRIWVIANTRYFTEYSLPYVVGVLPVVSWVWRFIAHYRAHA